MKLGSALAFLALAALTPSIPASAAKDEKLPRCNGRQKRPANPYGTVLPTIPARNAVSAASTPPEGGVPRGTPSAQPSPPPTTNLFPPENAAPAPTGPDTSRNEKVPAIGAVSPGGPTAALQTSYASC
jgi:hypothetical protein